MPRRDFLNDLVVAQTSPLPSNIQQVRAGEGGGQVTFLITRGRLSKTFDSGPAKITASISEVGDYPKSHKYTMIAVHADEVLRNQISFALGDAEVYAHKTILDMLREVSAKVSTVISSGRLFHIPKLCIMISKTLAASVATDQISEKQAAFLAFRSLKTLGRVSKGFSVATQTEAEKYRSMIQKIQNEVGRPWLVEELTGGMVGLPLFQVDKDPFPVSYIEPADSLVESRRQQAFKEAYDTPGIIPLWRGNIVPSLEHATCYIDRVYFKDNAGQRRHYYEEWTVQQPVTLGDIYDKYVDIRKRTLAEHLQQQAMSRATSDR